MIERRLPLGIVYNAGVVPEYEGDEDGESAVYPAE